MRVAGVKHIDAEATPKTLRRADKYRTMAGKGRSRLLGKMTGGRTKTG